jgi:CRISPR-associated endoribonuclease Cas6
MTTGIHVLPVNYQYPVSAWIYKVISQGNHAFAEYLHEHGYGDGNKAFKLFTFSMLDLSHGRYRLTDDRIEFIGEELLLTLSFLVPKALEHFITGLFLNQEFSIGDRTSQVHFRVKSVEAIPEPIFNDRMRFRTISPLLISQQVEGIKAARYLHPVDHAYSELITNNLTNKLRAIQKAGMDIPDLTPLPDMESYQTQIKILSKPRKKGITIKANTPQQTQIIGFLYDFEITAPVPLLRIGYHAGFGEKNSLGMGCCEIITSQSS